MLSAISKRNHASIGKSVTSFMAGRRDKGSLFSALQNDAIAPERRLLRDSNTSGLGGKAEIAGARSKRR
jgi:hypothetical protein